MSPQQSPEGLLPLKKSLCFVCSAEVIFNLDYDEDRQLLINNLSLCQRFCTVADCYFNLNGDFSEPANIKFNWDKNTTVNGNNLLKGDFLKDHDQDDGHRHKQISCCSCFQDLKTFCDIYEDFSLIKIKLNTSAQNIAQLMKDGYQSKDETPQQQQSNSNVDELFRKLFLSRVENGYNFPRVGLSRLKPTPEVLVHLSSEQLTPSPEDVNDHDDPTTPLQSHQIQDDFEDQNEFQVVNEVSTKNTNSPSPSFKCKFCGEAFFGAGLARHESIHTKTAQGGKFSCGNCGLKYHIRSSCSKHLRRVHNGQGTVISLTDSSSHAGEISNVPNEAKANVRIVQSLKTRQMGMDSRSMDQTTRGKFKCQFCSKRFATHKYKSQHEKIHSKPYGCRFCEKRFSLRTTMETHQKGHMGVKPFQCSVCGVRYRDKIPCKKHIQKIHNGCGEIIKNPTTSAFGIKSEPGLELRSEVNIVGGNKEDETCKNHLRKIHGVQDGVQSLIKVQKNSNPDYLPVPVAHSIASATRNANEPGDLNIFETAANYPIEDENLCQINTDTATQTQQKQTKSTKFKCQFWSKRFTRHNYKAQHEKSHAKPFGCRFCGMRFTFKARMEVHERSHTKIKIKVEPEIESLITSTSEIGGVAAATSSATVNSSLYRHRCNVCNKGFAYRQGLNEHKSVHSGEKPFHCELCDAKFRLRKYLTQHMLIHTEQRRYQCEICLLQFKRRKQCNGHVRKLHGVKDGSGIIVNNLQISTSSIKPSSETGASANGNQQSLSEAQPTAAAVAANQAQDFKTSGNAVQKKFKCRFLSKNFSMDKHRTKHEKIHNGRGDILRILQDKRIKSAPEESGSRSFVISVPTKTVMTNMTMTAGNNLDTAMKAQQSSLQQVQQAPTANDGNANFLSANETCSVQETSEPENRFKCQFCGKGFSNSKKRNSHKRIHRKPFTCTICGKGFSFRNRLTSHALTHAGIKLYECGTCGQRFSNRGNCKVHQMNVHGIADGEILKDLLLDDNTTQIRESFEDFASSTSTVQESGNLELNDTIENNEAETTEDVVVKPDLDSYLLEVEGDAAEFNLIKPRPRRGCDRY